MQEFASRASQWAGALNHELNCLKSRKLVRIMKITAVILLGACLQLSARGLSQTISLSVKDASLRTVFKSIEKQTGFDFFFDEELLKTAKRVTINVNNLPLSQVLEICFKEQPFSYIISGKTITLVRKKEIAAVIDKHQINNSSLFGIDVKGRIVDSNGDPIANATITVKGTSKSTATNANGEFTLAEVDVSAVIVVSHVQFETKVFSIKEGSYFNITLQTKVSNLDELQVIAYGTTTKRLNTGNVSTVKSSEIALQPVLNPMLALQGRVPGLQITQSTGVPGSAVLLRIRGQNSIQNGNDPLIVIDGVPYFSQNIATGIDGILGNAGSSAGGSPLSNINPADIESIDVLKDADATAIYGSRGANGVILITTKKGKSGKMKVDLAIQSGRSKVPKKVNLLTTDDYLEMRREAFLNDGASPNQDADFDFSLWDTTRNTDWQKELIGGTAKYSDVQLTLSGGAVSNQYLVGIGHNKETTVFPNEQNSENTSIHFNINSASANQKFKLLLSGKFLRNTKNLMAEDLTNYALKLAPNAPAIYNEDGSLNWAPKSSGETSWTNPLSYTLRKFKNEIYNLIANAAISYQVLPGLEVKATGGITFTQNNQIYKSPLTSNDPYLWPILGNNGRVAQFANSNVQSFIFEPQLNYNRKLWKGDLSFLVGTSINQSKANSVGVSAYGFNSDYRLEDLSSATFTSASSGNSIYKYNALFGRLNYNWLGKYLLNITWRRDGTSRFGPANQFHNFSAFGAGWVFSKEKFVEQNIKFLSFGKIRSSYGTTGSDQVGDYTFMDLYSTVVAAVPYQGASGLRITRLFTPDLAWEETKKMEAAMELGFFHDRVFISGSYYKNRSSNQLSDYLLPNVSGFSSIKRNLPATVQNLGTEFQLSTVNIQKRNFTWRTSFNISMNRNKLIKIDSGMSINYRNKLNKSLNSNFIYNYLGVDPTSGLYQVADKDGNATMNPDPLSDALINVDLTPKYFGGISNTILYKGIQLDFLVHFVKQQGSNSFYYGLAPGSFIAGLGNQPVSVLNRWKKPGDNAPVQKFNQDYSHYQDYDNAVNYSTLPYSDASYLRLKNVSISWEVPKKWRDAIRVQTFKVYLHCQNLVTITNYKGLDPETQSSASLPPLRTITVGLNATF